MLKFLAFLSFDSPSYLQEFWLCLILEGGNGSVSSDNSGSPEGKEHYQISQHPVVPKNR